MSPDFPTATFKTSSYSESNGTCVEVAVIPGYAAVRDTKDRTSGHITVPAASFTALLTTLKN
ncbi:DUF397 domain-containing protein [Amycolatopsis sp. NPDC059027]|uniref:DUF397 domain-containing protein n=1 Tax=unclassified Amycolatopsis TaxID=2618356 RepID=UPI00366EFC57